jgi:alkanesulfonate monooxygenase SsuD/methylene tetrahydromethanopterin reductase-like flavin-dependent oxidoreductase (luciferase family)
MPADRPLHLGVQLGTSGVSWPAIRDAALRVEELGYDSVWLPDHLVAREAGGSRLEAWALLGAIATITTRIRLGPLVTPVSFRHPAVLGKMAATLDHISSGRLIVGLGAGGTAADHEQFGLPLERASVRAVRLEDTATILRAMFRDGRATVGGRYHALADALAEPKPVQRRLPLLIAGASDAVLRSAARHADVWNVIAMPDGFRECFRRLSEKLATAGRHPPSVLATVSFRLIVRDSDREIGARVAELDPVWHDDPFRLAGSAASVHGALEAYVDAGAGGLIVQMPAPYDLTTLERLRREIRPLLGPDPSPPA